MNGKRGLWTIAAVATLILISAGGVCSASFTDITASSGTGGPSWYGGHGVQFGDATGDGRPDFYVTMNADQDMADLFYRNSNGSSFAEEGNLRGVASFDTGSHGGVWADLDNDGDYDLFNGAYQRNRIYRNNGSGFFTDVTAAAQLPDRQWLTRGVLAFDMDKDGDLDLFAVTGYQGTNDPAGEKNEVYRNEGNMVFTAVNSGALYDAPAGQGATDSDFDGDGDIDIIAANRTGDVNILRNDGAGNFQLVTPASLGINHAAGDGITLADVNNDGHLDLLLQKTLYLNAGNNTYVFKNTFTAPGYMGGFEDLDNDGDWDLVFTGDNKVYYNDGGGNYSASPTFATGLINDPRSVAFADIEGDGDVDFFYAQKNTYSRLIRNDYQGGNRWLEVKLVRSNGQAGAYGAKVYIYAAGQLGVAGSRITWREARSQEGYLGQNDPVLHFGVGPRDQVDVRVVFLGGATVEESFVNVGQRITVNESGIVSDCVLAPRFGQAALAVGLKYYTDRDYVLTAVPAAYGGMAAITTPNDDRDLTTANGYLTFEMPSDGTVYVAYDSRATGLPDWMDGFAYTGATIETSLASQPSLRIYGKAFSAGDCVNLGANKAAGFAGDTVSNYLVFYGASEPADETPPVWQDQTGICSAQGTGTGGSVRLNFGAATDDISGSNVVYNIYFAPTAVWNGSNWPVNQKLAGVVPSTGETCTNGYTIDGLAIGTSYTFGVRAVDSSGNEDTNTNTAAATPTGEVQSSFDDDFSTDTRSEYGVDQYWTDGGSPRFLYDAVGQRLQVLTGDDVGVRFTHPLPVLDTGVFVVDFHPTGGYPDGGKMKVRLRADALNYYEVYNSDVYSDRQVAKYVNGVKVDSAPIRSLYSQGSNYRVTIFFSPQALIVEAFGETLILDNNPSAIAVSLFEVVVQQQDAYFDNFAMLDQAFVNLSSPMSYQFQSGDSIAVKAYAGNLQAGDGVKFVLREFDTGALQEEIEDFSQPYEHLFAGQAKGSYSVEALVIDSDRQPVAGVYTHHLAEPVGIGDYYVAFGDSITFGVGDDIAADDVSLDGWTTGGGYAPILANLLANHYGYPHFIANEGGPGDTSFEALAALPGLLDIHSGAGFFLILLGSNDSFDLSVASGLGPGGGLLTPGDPGYAGSFLSNMQQIINLVTAAGKVPILSKIPIALGDCSNPSQCPPFADPNTADRNLLIQDYNVVIDALAAANGISVVPPDFYGYFRAHPGEFFDNVHPDGTGYVSMAGLWFQALIN